MVGPSSLLGLARSPPAAAAPPAAVLPNRARQAQVSITVRDEDIASFKALGLELCLSVEGKGEVWLVPNYTGQDRQELSLEHAVLVAAACSAFPGASVKSFVRQPAKR
jgi:hypothetical protein